MQVNNPSPKLYNEDLAPAQDRKWGAFSIFNVWTSDVHSLWGYYLAASLFPHNATAPSFSSAIGLALLTAHPQDEWWDFAMPAEAYPARSLKRAYRWFKSNW